MKRTLLAAAAMLLASCGQNGPAQDARPDSLLSLTCERFAGMSGDALVAAYGAANVVDQSLPGIEGDSYTATIVNPNDVTRRLEIIWRDPARRDAPTSVIANGEGSLWVGPNNIRVGETLADVERANGQPFQLWGFGWDYGGWVSDWKDGAFKAANGCNVRARFSAQDGNNNAIGDGDFMSDNAAMRAANASVSEMGLMFATPPPAGQ